MLRQISGMFVLTIGVMGFSAGRADSAEHEHAEHFVKCARVCAECQVMCDSCYTHCLALLSEGKKEHAITATLCADCAECCKLAATLSARQSPLAAAACECCAKACERCGDACAKHPGDKHMTECAKSCRDCAKVCREMLEHIGGKK
jgi:hypothetical protein